MPQEIIMINIAYSAAAVLLGQQGDSVKLRTYSPR
jgi:hypothetical protein